MWPFTRKPKPIDPGPLNEDWRDGDLAECIDKGAWLPGPSGPEYGDVLRVECVRIGRAACDGKPWWFLDFRSWPRGGYDARSFRKLPPQSTEATAEFTAQIKAIRPAKKTRKVKS